MSKHSNVATVVVAHLYVFIKIPHSKVIRAQFSFLGGEFLSCGGGLGKRWAWLWVNTWLALVKNWSILGECQNGFESQL